MKNKIVRDDELTLIKKFKRYFFVIFRSEIDITFYILRDRGSVDIDTTDYFGVSFSFEDGVPMIGSIFSNKTKFTLKHSIETGFHYIARFTPLGKKEEMTCISVHWPEPDDKNDQPEAIDAEDEDIEKVQCEAVKTKWPDPSMLPPPPKPIWVGEKIEPLKPVEDN